jgi:hypothetical protein
MTPGPFVGFVRPSMFSQRITSTIYLANVRAVLLRLLNVSGALFSRFLDGRLSQSQPVHVRSAPSFQNVKIAVTRRNKRR